MDPCGTQVGCRTSELVSRSKLPRQWGVTRQLLFSAQTQKLFTTLLNRKGAGGNTPRFADNRARKNRNPGSRARCCARPSSWQREGFSCAASNRMGAFGAFGRRTYADPLLRRRQARIDRKNRPV